MCMSNALLLLAQLVLERRPVNWEDQKQAACMPRASPLSLRRETFREKGTQSHSRNETGKRGSVAGRAQES